MDIKPKKNRRGRTVSDGLSMPIQRSKQQVNKRALAADKQLRNQTVERKNRNPRGTRYTNQRTAGGSTVEVYSQYHPKEGVKGVRTHDISIDRTVNQKPGGTPFKFPSRGGEGRQIQGNQMKALLGFTLDNVPVGDYVEGEFFSGDQNQAKRAQWFDKQTNGVLHGDKRGAFSAKRLDQTHWQRADGKVVEFNPKSLANNIGKEAVKQVMRWAGGAPAQGALALDGLIEFSTGKGIAEHHKDEMTPSVEAYDKKGVRVPSWGYSAPF